MHIIISLQLDEFSQLSTAVLPRSLPAFQKLPLTLSCSYYPHPTAPQGEPL